MAARKGKIVHCKKDRYDIYIGRPGPWGNPFNISKEGNREEARRTAIKRFEDWLMRKKYLDFEQHQRRWILRNLRRLKGRTLGCWCAPKPCHGDILIKLLNQYLNGEWWCDAQGEIRPGAERKIT